jgi:hypothetical protein
MTPKEQAIKGKIDSVSTSQLKGFVQQQQQQQTINRVKT